MKPIDCVLCDRATTRTAVLVIALRKAAGQLHGALGHGGHWMDCSQSPCRESAAAAKGT
jgi:hypothetical protein